MFEGGRQIDLPHQSRKYICLITGPFIIFFIMMQVTLTCCKPLREKTLQHDKGHTYISHWLNPVFPFLASLFVFPDGWPGINRCIFCACLMGMLKVFSVISMHFLFVNHIEIDLTNSEQTKNEWISQTLQKYTYCTQPYLQTWSNIKNKLIHSNSLT